MADERILFDFSAKDEGIFDKVVNVPTINGNNLNFTDLEKEKINVLCFLFNTHLDSQDKENVFIKNFQIDNNILGNFDKIIDDIKNNKKIIKYKTKTEPEPRNEITFVIDKETKCIYEHPERKRIFENRFQLNYKVKECEIEVRKNPEQNNKIISTNTETIKIFSTNKTNKLKKTIQYTQIKYSHKNECRQIVNDGLKQKTYIIHKNYGDKFIKNIKEQQQNIFRLKINSSSNSEFSNNININNSNSEINSNAIITKNNGDNITFGNNNESDNNNEININNITFAKKSDSISIQQKNLCNSHNSTISEKTDKNLVVNSNLKQFSTVYNTRIEIIKNSLNKLALIKNTKTQLTNINSNIRQLAKKYITVISSYIEQYKNNEESKRENIENENNIIRDFALLKAINNHITINNDIKDISEIIKYLFEDNNFNKNGLISKSETWSFYDFFGSLSNSKAKQQRLNVLKDKLEILEDKLCREVIIPKHNNNKKIDITNFENDIISSGCHLRVLTQKKKKIEEVDKILNEQLIKSEKIVE